MTDYPDFLKSTKDILSSMAMDQCALQNINERIESFCKVIKQSVWSLGGHGIISSDQGLSICLELLIKAKEKKASVYVIGKPLLSQNVWYCREPLFLHYFRCF